MNVLGDTDGIITETDYWEDGVIRSVERCKNCHKNDKLVVPGIHPFYHQGSVCLYKRDGKLERYFEWKGAYLHGKERTYDDDGKVISEQDCIGDIIVSKP